MARAIPSNPRRILLIKSHSAGIGDILRSSAAWAVLKKRWPDVELHLLFLTRWPGYPSEALIREHFLLSSAHFLAMQEGRFWGMRGVGPRTWRRLLPELRKIAEQIQPDLIIDHEPHGLETALVTRFLRYKLHDVATIGVAQVPGRGFLYDRASISFKEYMRERNILWPMDYTERDFVALTALGLARHSQPISLDCTNAGKNFKENKLNKLGTSRLLGLNIGCGTKGAESRRPPVELLVASLGPQFLPDDVTILLSGSAEEQVINERFIEQYRQSWGESRTIMDFAGKLSLSELTGLITECHVFISSDSGPYHMAVGLAIPTIALFNFEEPTAYHCEKNIQILVAPTSDQLGVCLQHHFQDEIIP